MPGSFVFDERKLLYFSASRGYFSRMNRPLLLLVVLLLFSIVAPGQSDVRSLIAASEKFEREDSFPEAIDAITKAIEIQPDSADLYNRRGMLYYGTANKEKAVADFKKAAELGPDDERIVFNAARLLIHFEHCTDALAILDSYISRNATNARAFFDRAISKKCLNDLPGHFNDISAAIELDPTNNAYRSAKAAILDDLGDSEKAFELHVRLIDSVEQRLTKIEKPEEAAPLKRDLAVLYRGRARFLHARGETALEFADLAKMVQHEPTFYSYHVRAEAYVEHKMLSEAIDDLTQAIRIAKHSPIESLIRRAEVHVLAGDLAEAVKDYETVLKIEGVLSRETIEQRLAELRGRIVN